VVPSTIIGPPGCRLENTDRRRVCAPRAGVGNGNSRCDFARAGLPAPHLPALNEGIILLVIARSWPFRRHRAGDRWSQALVLTPAGVRWAGVGQGSVRESREGNGSGTDKKVMTAPPGAHHPEPGQSVLGEVRPPGPHRRRGDPDLLRDHRVGDPACRGQQHPFGELAVTGVVVITRLCPLVTGLGCAIAAFSVAVALCATSSRHSARRVRCCSAAPAASKRRP